MKQRTRAPEVQKSEVDVLLSSLKFAELWKIHDIPQYRTRKRQPSSGNVQAVALKWPNFVWLKIMFFPPFRYSQWLLKMT